MNRIWILKIPPYTPNVVINRLGILARRTIYIYSRATEYTKQHTLWGKPDYDIVTRTKFRYIAWWLCIVEAIYINRFRIHHLPSTARNLHRFDRTRKWHSGNWNVNFLLKMWMTEIKEIKQHKWNFFFFFLIIEVNLKLKKKKKGLLFI